jgi:hypothetical protein
MKTTLVVAASLVLTILTACNLPAQAGPVASFPELPFVAPPPTVTSPSVIAEYLTDPKVISYDPLDSMSNWNFSNETGALTNGVFELNGSPGWHSSFWPKQRFNEGQGLVIRFKVQMANARSEFVFVTGDWMRDSFRQFGVYNAVTPKGDLFQGDSDLGGYDLRGGLTMQSGTWYDLLLAIGQNGHFLAVIWNPNDEARRAVHDVMGGANWAGRGWVFLPKANSGEIVYADSFYRLSFGDIK